MAPSVQRYFQDGLAPATQRTYKAAMKRFHSFCLRFNVENPFPLSEHLLCCFASFLADQGLAPQTGKSYMSALRSMQISLGLPDPREQSSLPVLKRVQAGIRRARMIKGATTRIRLPITAPVLWRIRDALQASSHPHRVVLWAIACTAFFGFFRLGELLPEKAAPANPALAFSWDDVAIDDQANPQVIRLHLRHSKCDQFGNGADIFLGRTGAGVCPVAALLGYMVVRGDRPGIFFCKADGHTVTKAWFIEQLRPVLGDVGLPQHQYAGHSFRIGAATTAALAGVADSTIQALGRWSSAAFLQYIRMPRDQLATLSRVMVQPLPAVAPATSPAATPS